MHRELNPYLQCLKLRKTSWYQNLVITLLYYRQYITFKLLSWIFQVDSSTVSRNIEHISKSLLKWSTTHTYFPDRFVRQLNGLSFKNASVTLLIDGTEQQVSIPTGKQIEQAIFSWNKKKHTFTRLICVSPKGQIYFVSDSHPGSFNDLNCYNIYNAHKKLTAGEWVVADVGFQGCGTHHNFIPAFLKASTSQLSPDQELFNRKVASILIVVEKVISLVKKWKICSTTYTCKFSSLEKALEQNWQHWKICSALVNRFNLRFKQ